MTLNITEGTIPAVTQNRTREPNPFDGRFPTAEGKSLVVELPSSNDEETKFVNKVVAQAQKAARETVTDDAPQGYTAKVKREAVEIGSGKAKKAGTRLTIWTVDRIFRTRKGAAEGTPAAE